MWIKPANMTEKLVEHLFHNKILDKLEVYSTGGENVKRERQQRWDDNHMRTVSTKMTLGEWTNLRLQCLEAGVTPYALVLDLLRQWMMQRH